MHEITIRIKVDEQQDTPDSEQWLTFDAKADPTIATQEYVDELKTAIKDLQNQYADKDRRITFLEQGLQHIVDLDENLKARGDMLRMHSFDTGYAVGMSNAASVAKRALAGKAETDD